MAEKPRAYRKLRFTDGKLVVVFIDAANGNEIPQDQLGNYNITSAGGFLDNSGVDKKEEEKKQETPFVEPRESGQGDPDTSGSNKSFWEEWYDNPKISKGSGDIVGDLGKAFGNLKSNIISGVVQQVLKTDKGQEMLKDGVKGATDAVGAKATQVANDVGNKVGGILSSIMPNGLFGEGPQLAEKGNLVGQSPLAKGPVINDVVGKDGVTRNKPISDETTTKFAAAVTATDPRLSIQVTSAGQDAEGANRVGSHRHDVDASGFGQTADFRVLVDGKPINPSTDRSITEPLIRNLAAVGFTGIGVGNNIIHAGGGTPAIWGYGPDGGKTKYAADWMVTAYNEGIQLNKQGAGEKLVADYVAKTKGNVPTNNTNVQIAQNTAPPGVDPKLASILAPSGDMNQKSLGNVATVTPAATNNINAQTSALFSPTASDKASNKVGATVNPNIETLNQGQAAAVDTTTAQVPTDSGLTVQQEAFLNTLNKMEGSPLPNQAFGYVGFDDMSKHPDIYNKQYNTTAAGFLQINAPTWNEFAPKVGVNDFELNSQLKVGWQIASDNYKAKTGKDLNTVLNSGDPVQLASAFSESKNRWASIPKTDTNGFKNMLSFYNDEVTNITNKNNMKNDAKLSTFGDVVNTAPASLTTPTLTDDMLSPFSATGLDTYSNQNLGSFNPAKAVRESGGIAGSKIDNTGSAGSLAGGIAGNRDKNVSGSGSSSSNYSSSLSASKASDKASNSGNSGGIGGFTYANESSNNNTYDSGSSKTSNTSKSSSDKNGSVQSAKSSDKSGNSGGLGGSSSSSSSSSRSSASSSKSDNTSSSSSKSKDKN